MIRCRHLGSPPQATTRCKPKAHYQRPQTPSRRIRPHEPPGERELWNPSGTDRNPRDHHPHTRGTISAQTPGNSEIGRRSDARRPAPAAAAHRPARQHTASGEHGHGSPQRITDTRITPPPRGIAENRENVENRTSESPTRELRNSGTPEGTETPEKSASLAASRAGDRHGTPPTEGPGTHPLRDRAHIRRGPEDLPPRDPGTCPPRSPRSPTHRTAARRGPRSRFRQPRQKTKEAVPARAAAPDRAPPAPEGRKRQRGRRLHPRRRRRPLCPSIRRHPRRQRTRSRAGGRGGRHHPRRSPPHRPPSPPGAAGPIVTRSAPRGHCREPAIFMPS